MRPADARRHHRHAYSCDSAMYARPFPTNSAAVMGSPRWVHTRPRWTAPATASITEAASVVPAIWRGRRIFVTTNAAGIATRPRYRPIAWSGEIRTCHELGGAG